MTSLTKDFFARDTLTVAEDLIGAILMVGNCQGRIVETEAYTTDEASHSITRRNKATLMAETFGHVYVYLIYGMYYCLNFTTERDGIGAVLIRAVEPVSGIEEMIKRRETSDVRKLASGPGRLCEAFGIDLRFNGHAIGKKIKLLAGEHRPVVARSRRIGISKAVELEWRFYEQANPFVSKQMR